MKKIFALILLFIVVTSCSLDDGVNVHFEAIPVTDATLPDAFILNETYEITVDYIRPNNCYVLEGFDFLRTGENERTITLINSVFSDRECPPEPEERQATFEFVVLNTGTYTFKFWNGNDENGDPDFLIVEVPVTEEEEE